MSIQQDVLDTIGENGIAVTELQTRLGNIGSNELDLVMRALMRALRVKITGGRYYVQASTHTLGTMPHHIPTTLPPPPPTAAEELAANLKPVSNKKPILSFKTARRAPKSLESVMDLTPPAPPDPPAPCLSPSVFERVQMRKQEALDRIETLTVELANQRAEVDACDTFLGLYHRFEKVIP